MNKFTGTVLLANTMNRNHRIYPLTVLQTAVDNFNVKLTENTQMGELGQGENLSVDVERASHTIEKIWVEGNEIKSTIEFLETPPGKLLQELIESEIDLALAPRGTGYVSEDGVISNYEITTIDIIAADQKA